MWLLLGQLHLELKFQAPPPEILYMLDPTFAVKYRNVGSFCPESIRLVCVRPPRAWFSY